MTGKGGELDSGWGRVRNGRERERKVGIPTWKGIGSDERSGISGMVYGGEDQGTKRYMKGSGMVRTVRKGRKGLGHGVQPVTWTVESTRVRASPEPVTEQGP